MTADRPTPGSAAGTAHGTTIRDIAQAAGVSIGTVSRALKNQRGLSDETRRHIRTVARELGYDLARLRAGKAQRLAFLVHRQHSNFAVNPFFGEVMHGVESACRELGMAPTLLSAGPGDPIRDLLRLHEPDAVLVAGYFESEVLAILARMDLPLALIDGWVPGCAAINPDNAGGGYQATRHLLDLGRRRIGYIAGSLAHFSIRERERGYRRALFEAGVLADPDLEALAPPGLDDVQGAAAAMRTLLRRRERPDAVFAYNDSAALMAMRVCQEAGLRIPEDIAFVGFDDIPEASYGALPLTTLRVDKAALGRAGVALLVEGESLPRESTLPVELIVRASSAPTPTSATPPSVST